MSIRKAIEMGTSYLQKFKAFDSMLQLEASKYKLDLESKKLSLKDLLAEIRGHKADQDNIERRSLAGSA